MLRFTNLPPDRGRGARSVAPVARPRRSSPAITNGMLHGFADHIFNRPLAITEAGLELLLAYTDTTIDAASTLNLRSDEDDDGDYSLVDGIACIRVHGPLLKNRDALTDFFGISTYEALTRQFNHALRSDDVSAILLDIDSSGGECAGCADLSDLIYSSRGRKRIWALSNDSMYSAAYWIGSAADQVFVSRDAGAGSIGCYIMHLDRSGLDEQCGLKFSYIFSGPRKVDGNTHEALSDRARATLQAEVNRTTDNFVAAISRNRGVDASQIYKTESGIFFASACLPLLADRCSSLDEAMMSLRVAAGVKLTPGASAFQQNKSAAAIAAPAPAPARLPARRLSSLPAVNESAMAATAIARMSLTPPARAAGMDQPIAVVRRSQVRNAFSGTREMTMLVCPYSSPSVDLGGFKEIYSPGCFSGDGLSGDPVVLWNHNEDFILARATSGARFYETSVGVRCDFEVPNTNCGDDLLELARTSVITGSSAGFWLQRYHWETRNGERYRIVDKAVMREACPVSLPAYISTTAAIQPASIGLAAARLRLLRLGA